MFAGCTDLEPEVSTCIYVPTPDYKLIALAPDGNSFMRNS